MFQSIKTTNYLVGEEYDNYAYEYELTDSDFGTVSGVVVEDGLGGVGVAVIQEYSKRKLNVGKNLMLAFVWYNK